MALTGQVSQHAQAKRRRYRAQLHHRNVHAQVKPFQVLVIPAHWAVNSTCHPVLWLKDLNEVLCDEYACCIWESLATRCFNVLGLNSEIPSSYMPFMSIWGLCLPAQP